MENMLEDGSHWYNWLIDILNIIIDFIWKIILLFSNLLGIEKEVSSILLVEILLLIFTLVWIKTRTLRLKRKVSKLIVEADISREPSLSRVEMFKISFLSLKISILYAFSIIIMIISMFITILAFQPYDPHIFLSSILMYIVGFVILIYAWILTKRFALKEIEKIKEKIYFKDIL